MVVVLQVNDESDKKDPSPTDLNSPLDVPDDDEKQLQGASWKAVETTKKCKK